MSDNNDIRSRLAALVQSSTFVPTGRLISLRNRFYEAAGTQVPPEADLAAVIALAPSSAMSGAIERNWSTPGFAEWFLSPTWAADEATALLHRALVEVSHILDNASDPAIRLNAAKEARELYMKLNVRPDAEKFSDEAVQRMSRSELEEFIRRNSPKSATTK